MAPPELARVRITVDGAPFEVEAGRTILQALDDHGVLMNGVDLPHYCWHPKLSIDGSCRLCQVEVEIGGERLPKLQIACDTVVREGMAVHTKTEAVRRAREGVMELLLVNHPLDCPICDQAGECKLQDYAYEYGVGEARSVEPRRAAKKRVDLGPTIIFDQERCILCRRCVRFCREVPGSGELGIFDRGDRSVVEVFPGERLDNPYSMNVADICPVGALTTKDFRFKMRVWFLKDVEGVCTGCARGCNVHLGVAKNEVQRYVPRRNDAVNETWMCDEGRLSYGEIGREDRLRRCGVRDEEGVLVDAEWPAALEAAAVRLRRLVAARGAGVVAGVASAHASNEDLFTFRRFLDALEIEASGLAVLRGEADELLVAADKGPNAAGARALGFGDAAPVVERLRGGGVDGLVVLGHELLDEAWLGEPDALERLDTVIVLDTHHSALERVAHVVFPVRHVAERHGTYTNCEGRVQRAWPAVEPAWDARAAGEVIEWLGGALGLEGLGGEWDAIAVSARLASEVEAFAGCSFESCGPGGQVLATTAARGGTAGEERA